MSSKRRPPRGGPRPDAEPVDDDLRYFKARKLVTNYEVRECAKLGRFDEVEDVLFSHGKFLERHPEAQSID